MWLLLVIMGLIPVEPFEIRSPMAQKRLAPIVTPTGMPPPSSMPSLPPLTLPSLPITIPTLPSIRPNFTLPSLPPGMTIPPLIDARGGAPSLKLRDVETLTNIVPSGGDALASRGGFENEGVISFPKNKRSITYKESYSRQKRQANCGCFITSLCPPNVTTTAAPIVTTTTTTPAPNYGAGLIDFRIVGGAPTGPACMTGFAYCCVKPTPQVSCGSRLSTNNVYPTVSGQAKYGDYPWMVVILAPDSSYVGGGTLIDTLHVITVAHRISNYPNGNGLKVRLGEWDAAGNYEQFPYKDYSVARVWTHEAYNPNTLQNDISLMRISGGIASGIPSVVPVCMPAAAQMFDGQRCWVSGWGKDSFGVVGTYQTVLKAIDVPVLPSGSCEATLRTTRLGTAFILDKASFICAGGESNKDACTGDGGSGLVCEVSPGRWVLAGMVAWGIGCAAQGVPAAYVNIVNYLSWIASKQALP